MPALAVADRLRSKGFEVTFAGARGRTEAELVPRAGYPIDLLDLAGIDRRNPVKAARAAGLAAMAVPAARKILRDRRPDVVMGGGGFVAGPAGLAAITLGIPLVLTEADRHLGLANRLLKGRADVVCLAFDSPGVSGPNVVVTGRPVEKSVLDGDRDRARSRFGIGEGRKCLLIVGGSLGARSINRVAVEAFADPASRDFDVIQISGVRDHPEVGDLLASAGDPVGYTLLEYEPDLGDCLAAADLVLGRSGGSVFELAATGTPAILVPYPHATGDHQTSNAEWMASAGAAVIVADDDLDPVGLKALASDLLDDDERLRDMAAASSSLARPDAAEHVADLVADAAGVAS